MFFEVTGYEEETICIEAENEEQAKEMFDADSLINADRYDVRVISEEEYLDNVEDEYYDDEDDSE